MDSKCTAKNDFKTWNQNPTISKLETNNTNIFNKTFTYVYALQQIIKNNYSLKCKT